MALSRPLGTIIPDAVFEDIGLFFNEEQLNEFRSLSPRANRLFKKYRMISYTHASIAKNAGVLEICWRFDKIWQTIELGISNGVDSNKKLSTFLLTCNSIGDLTIRNFHMCDELMKIVIRIKTKKLDLVNMVIPASLSLFGAFLRRHPNVINFNSVLLPRELVSNNTLKLMSEIDLVQFYDAKNSSCENEVVDVTDDFLRETNTSFILYDFKTKFTMEGISQFLEKIEHTGRSCFGILSSDQLHKAIDYERSHHNEQNIIFLQSSNGQKVLAFYVNPVIQNLGSRDNYVTSYYFVNLNLESNSMNMIPIPDEVIGPLTQVSFELFDKIMNNPEQQYQLNQFEVNSISFNYEISTDSVQLTYNLFDESNAVIIERTNITLKDVHNFIVAFFSNCFRIHWKIMFYGISLDEDLYELLKPISVNIEVRFLWNIDIFVKPESLRAILETEGGLLGTIDFIKSEYKSEELLPNEVFVLYIGRKFSIDVTVLTPESTSIGSDTWLTDKLLHLLGLKGRNLPEQYSFKLYQTMFTAKGIKEFIESVKAVRKDTVGNAHYVLGTVDESKAEEVVLLVQEYEKDEMNWRVTKNNITRNGQAYCTVVINIMINCVVPIPIVNFEFDIPNRADD